MARINNAKNFKGKSYVVTDEITNIINTLKFEGTSLQFTGAKVQDESEIGKTTTAVDLSGLISFVGTRTGNKIITTNAEGNFVYDKAVITSVGDTTSASDSNIPTQKAVRDAIDDISKEAINVQGGTGIKITAGTGTTKIISADIKLEKLGNATAGYASSYQLMVKDANADTYTASGATIDIPKDQFLKGAEIVEGTLNEGVFTENASGEKFIHFTFEINKKDVNGATTTTENHVYLNVHELVDAYTAGNGIDTIGSDNVIKVKADETDKIYATKGVETSVITVTSTGVKISGVQSAIDLAVTDAYTKTSAAISAVNTNVEAFESAVNTNISATVTSVNTKVNNAVSTVNTNVSSAVTAVNGKVDSAVANVNTAISSTVSNINTKVSALASQVVTIVDESITTAISEGIVTATVSAARIIAVYDENGEQIYPEIKRVISSQDNSVVYTLTAEFDAETVTTAPDWSVLCAKHTGVSYTNAEAVSANNVNAVSYNNVESGTNASYESANYNNAVTVASLDYKEAQAQA